MAFGPEGSNKHETVRHVLDKEAIEYVIVNCRECLSQRHLLTKIFARFVKHLNKEDLLDKCDRLDNLNALASNLRKILGGRAAPLVLVLMNADHQRGATATLLPALARLGELVGERARISWIIANSLTDTMPGSGVHIQLSTPIGLASSRCAIHSFPTISERRSYSDLAATSSTSITRPTAYLCKGRQARAGAENIQSVCNSTLRYTHWADYHIHPEVP